VVIEQLVGSYVLLKLAVRTLKGRTALQPIRETTFTFPQLFRRHSTRERFERILVGNITISRSKTVPLVGFGIVKRNSLAILKHIADITLRLRIALLRSSLEPFGGLMNVAVQTETLEVSVTQGILCNRFSLLSRLSEPLCNLKKVLWNPFPFEV
jgi:hypothetical protein